MRYMKQNNKKRKYISIVTLFAGVVIVGVSYTRWCVIVFLCVDVVVGATLFQAKNTNAEVYFTHSIIRTHMRCTILVLLIDKVVIESFSLNNSIMRTTCTTGIFLRNSTQKCCKFCKLKWNYFNWNINFHWIWSNIMKLSFSFVGYFFQIISIK